MSADSKNFLAVDMGQSGSRVRSSNGFEFSQGPAFNREAGLVASIETTLVAAGKPQADVVALSLTGVRGQVPNPSAIGLMCNQLTGAASVGITDDGIAALAGALGGRDGVAIAVGSGVVAVARKNNQVAHRDGDGPTLGDDGSGFWIGREGLRAAVRCIEDRGAATKLVSIIEEAHGSIYEAIRTKSDAEIMSWCLEVTPLVLKAAETGDAVAMSIRNSAVRLLSQTLASAWRGVGVESDSILASYTGGVMRDEEFKSEFISASQTLLPNISWQEPQGDNLDGALAIAKAEHIDLLPLLRWWQR